MPIKTLLTVFITLFLSNIVNAQTCKDYIPDRWPNSRYTDNGDGTILDKATKLVWKKCVEGRTGNDCEAGRGISPKWHEALALSSNSFAGKSDWRLPNIKELTSLAAFNCNNPSINESVFPNSYSGSFWSSSPDLNGSNGLNSAWLLHFGAGEAYYYGRDGSYGLVRLVRFGD